MTKGPSGYRRPDDRDRSGGQLPQWRLRLRSDFRLAIIALFCGCTVAAVLPLAVYRFASGDWRTGLGDLLVIALFTALSVYAWVSGRTRLASRLLSVVMTTGYLFLLAFGNISVMWAFPVLAGAFLLTDRNFATLCVLSVLVLSPAVPGAFDAPVELWSFLATGALVTLFGLIFATRTEIQRRQLAIIASHDPLTGAGNRRAMNAVLDALDRSVRNQGRPGSLVMFDLDHFKPINDVYGHEAGDRVLVNLVEVVEDVLRPEDRLFRVGGEEFVVVLPETGLEGAVTVAEKLRAAVAERLEGPGGLLSASFGVTELRSDTAPGDWLARADEALYEAKRAGRNQVVSV
jgi:diguanylate cyclase (GGDEF)-like protein